MSKETNNHDGVTVSQIINNPQIDLKNVKELPPEEIPKVSQLRIDISSRDQDKKIPKALLEQVSKIKLIALNSSPLPSDVQLPKPNLPQISDFDSIVEIYMILDQPRTGRVNIRSVIEGFTLLSSLQERNPYFLISQKIYITPRSTSLRSALRAINIKINDRNSDGFVKVSVEVKGNFPISAQLSSVYQYKTVTDRSQLLPIPVGNTEPFEVKTTISQGFLALEGPSQAQCTLSNEINIPITIQ